MVTYFVTICIKIINYGELILKCVISILAMSDEICMIPNDKPMPIANTVTENTFWHSRNPADEAIY